VEPAAWPVALSRAKQGKDRARSDCAPRARSALGWAVCQDAWRNRTSAQPGARSAKNSTSACRSGVWLWWHYFFSVARRRAV